MFAKIEVQTRSKVDLVDITEQVQQAVTRKEVETGICFIYCPHTTAGVVLNENWDPSVERDIATALEHIVPETLNYQHSEGNATSHIKAVLVGSDHFIFVHDGKLEMGRWQGIFLAEFDGPRRRTIWIKVLSDASSG